MVSINWDLQVTDMDEVVELLRKDLSGSNNFSELHMSIGVGKVSRHLHKVHVGYIENDFSRRAYLVMVSYKKASEWRFVSIRDGDLHDIRLHTYDLEAAKDAVSAMAQMENL